MLLPIPEENSTLLDLSKLLEFSEAFAWEDQYRHAPPEFQAELGMHIDRLGSACVLSLFQAPDPFYNRVIGLGLYEPVTERMLDELMDYIWGTDTEYFRIHLSPVAYTPPLHEWLLERGFWQLENHAKFFRDASPLPEKRTTLRIELTGLEYADAFAFVASQTFGMPEILYPWMKATVGQPGWRHYVAWDDLDPVAAGALYVRNGVGWLGHGSTLPTHRRLGAQGALLARRLADGIALGCQVFVTETNVDLPHQPDASYRNMLRNGFRLAYERSNYLFKKW